MKNNIKRRVLEKFYDLFEEEEDLITQKNENHYISLKKEIKSNIENRLSEKGVKGKPVIRQIWFRYASIAAAIALVIAFVFLYSNNSSKQERLELADVHAKPGGKNAVLTLANGQQILLNESDNGKIAAQTGVSIVKSADGLITYVVDQLDELNSNTAPQLNTITTPNGGEYALVLQDGTEVHLNAASSLTYPTSFAKTERSIELKGEAYFSVTKDAKRPFRVRSADHMVEVLGTHFNVNAYDNERTIKTTLEEGSVIVSEGGRSEKLLPGQQLVAGKGSNGKFFKRDVNVEQYIAWKDGFLTFENDDVKAVMRQLERWYKITITYDGEVSGTFSGELFKSSKLSTILNILEINGLHFKVNGKNITVSQNN
ncbi:MAG: DUF4974 domain-containing protein [Pedobacter sp.]|nr:MAG: DUF4974 domain-containing protein [Pedobacter sp.]